MTTSLEEGKTLRGQLARPVEFARLKLVGLGLVRILRNAFVGMPQQLRTG